MPNSGDLATDGNGPMVQAGFSMVHIQQSDLQGCLVQQVVKGLLEPTVPASELAARSGAGLNGFPRAKGPAWKLPSGRAEAASSPLLRSIPTTVLYDDRGLDLFDQITRLEEYYLTDAEAKILQKHAHDLVTGYVTPGMQLVELGAGSMCKTAHLLAAVQTEKADAPYYALDLCTQSLQDSMESLYKRFPGMQLTGLVGTYDAGIQYLASHSASKAPKMLLWLGSSVGNYSREEAATFLRKLNSEAMNDGDFLLIGIDRRNNKDVVEAAYNDVKGVTKEFIMNGLAHCNVLLGTDAFDLDKFEYAAGYNEREGRHEAYYRSRADQRLHLAEVGNAYQGGSAVQLHEGELIHIEYSYKYSPSEAVRLALSAGLCQVVCWTDPTGCYDLHLWQRPAFCWSCMATPSLVQPVMDAALMVNAAKAEAEAGEPIRKPNIAGARPVQRAVRMSDWQELWQAWDTVTLTTLPLSELATTQPISLRHPLIFYVGHVPAFLDRLLTHCLPGSKPTQPEHFISIFARGIDPDVDDPTKCHPHSDVPDSWPSLKSILEYQHAVRTRLTNLYGPCPPCVSSPPLERAIFMAFEHEAMHLETYMYMLVQEGRPCAPQGLAAPNFEPCAAPHAALGPVLSCSCAPLQHGETNNVKVNNASKIANGFSNIAHGMPPSASVNGVLTGVSGAPISNGANRILTSNGTAGITPLKGVDQTTPPNSSELLCSIAGDIPVPLPSDLVKVAGGVTTLGANVGHKAADPATSTGGENAEGSGSGPGPGSGSGSGSDSGWASSKFGWDNEAPELSIKVEDFAMQARPVTVAEYWHFLRAQQAKLAGQAEQEGEMNGDEGSTLLTWQALVPASWSKLGSTAARASRNDNAETGCRISDAVMHGCCKVVNRSRKLQNGHAASCHQLNRQSGSELEVFRHFGNGDMLNGNVVSGHSHGNGNQNGLHEAILHKRNAHSADGLKLRGSMGGNGGFGSNGSNGSNGYMSSDDEQQREDVQDASNHSDTKSMPVVDGACLSGQLHPKGFGVRTIFGPVPLVAAWNWPVYVSGEQAAAYAAAQGMRLPSEAEWVRVRHLSPTSLELADRLPAPRSSFWAAASRQLLTVGLGQQGCGGGALVEVTEGVVNGVTIASGKEGVQEESVDAAAQKLPGNYGFLHWGPRPVPGVKLAAGLGDTKQVGDAWPVHGATNPAEQAMKPTGTAKGGDFANVNGTAASNGLLAVARSHVQGIIVEDLRAVVDLVGNGWEWTSTEFTPHPGFQADELYPEYSTDFFDGKHAVVLGASWATHPCIAERSTFRNFYQVKYPYVFAKFRCAVDL